MLNKHDGVTKQDGLTTEYTETTEKEGHHSVCSACSVVGFLAGNLGKYLGLFNHGIHRNHGKRRLSFRVFGVFCGLNSWLVTWDSTHPMVALRLPPAYCFDPSGIRCPRRL
jgi:hypothetical protein